MPEQHINVQHVHRRSRHIGSECELPKNVKLLRRNRQNGGSSLISTSILVAKMLSYYKGILKKIWKPPTVSSKGQWYKSGVLSLESFQIVAPKKNVPSTSGANKKSIPHTEDCGK
ncbi:unnamed protein product [Hermetia illucens]|uniref:Uncharacterized protein n=1 Tax=Hermetia illucens TaxID=343691 RepID=A0A7R8UWJ2_HERIL|nr:unnamed protein product [Hermetia illucens]